MPAPRSAPGHHRRIAPRQAEIMSQEERLLSLACRVYRPSDAPANARDRSPTRPQAGSDFSYHAGVHPRRRREIPPNGA
jgi:hypothetical protein